MLVSFAYLNTVQYVGKFCVVYIYVKLTSVLSVLLKNAGKFLDKK